MNRPPHEHETKRLAISSQQYTFFDEKAGFTHRRRRRKQSKACFSPYFYTCHEYCVCAQACFSLLGHCVHQGRRKAKSELVGSVSAGKHGSSTYTLRIIAACCLQGGWSRVGTTNIMHSLAFVQYDELGVRMYHLFSLAIIHPFHFPRRAVWYQVWHWNMRWMLLRDGCGSEKLNRRVLWWCIRICICAMGSRIAIVLADRAWNAQRL